jgi:Fe2+ or Zn2+ uptake regulation protein
MKSFADSLRESRRLALLQLLAQQPGYESNHSILHAALHGLGVPSGRDDIITDLHWLSDQGLVDLREPVEGVLVAALRARGQEVAHGAVIMPGIQRPSAR